MRLFPQVPSDLDRLYVLMEEGKIMAVPSTFIRGAAIPVRLENGILSIIDFYHGTKMHDFSARLYAEEHWGKELIEVGAQDAIKVYLQDPNTLEVSHCAYIALSRPWLEIAKDKTKPKSELINEAIVYLTGDRLVFRELISAMPETISAPVFFQCSGCGGELADNGCRMCKQTFAFDHRDIKWNRQSWRCAIPEKLEDFFEKDCREPFFRTSPVMSRVEERKNWQAE
jgi:hypothetical protein